MRAISPPLAAFTKQTHGLLIAALRFEETYARLERICAEQGTSLSVIAEVHRLRRRGQ